MGRRLLCLLGFIFQGYRRHYKIKETYFSAAMYCESVEDRSSPVCDVREGDIMKAKPKYFEPRPSGTVSTTTAVIYNAINPNIPQGGIGQHPVIILTNPDIHGRVEVATMSHSHPHGPPTRPASWYGLPIDPVKGESTVSVGPPQRIHISFLRPHSPYARMCPAQFLELKKEIGEYSFIPCCEFSDRV